MNRFRHVTASIIAVMVIGAVSLLVNIDRDKIKESFKVTSECLRVKKVYRCDRDECRVDTEKGHQTVWGNLVTEGDLVYKNGWGWKLDLDGRCSKEER